MSAETRPTRIFAFIRTSVRRVADGKFVTGKTSGKAWVQCWTKPGPRAEEYPARRDGWYCRGGLTPRGRGLDYPRVQSLLVTTGSCSARSRSRSRLPMCSDSGACTHL